MTGRRGARASEKAGFRDVALDTASGGLESNVYRPNPGEKGYQGQGGTGGEFGRRGARASDKAGARDMGEPTDTKMAFGSKKPAADSFAAQKKELENKLKSGMLTKKRYDEMLAKLTNPDAVIDYAKSGFERAGRSKEGTSVPAGEGEFKGAGDATLTPEESKRFEELKKRKVQGKLSESENDDFVWLRDKIGRVGFKSAGATRK